MGGPRLRRRFRRPLVVATVGLGGAVRRCEPWCSRNPGSSSPATSPRPEVGDDDGLVRVVACRLCEHWLPRAVHTGALAGGFAFVPGHETVGVIEAIGGQAAERWGVAVGDRVAVEVFQSCRASRPAWPASTADASGTAWPTCTASSRSTSAWAVGWLRRAPVPGARLDGLAGPGCARCAGGDVVQPPSGPAFGGGHGPRARARATWSPSSAPRSAG